MDIFLQIATELQQGKDKVVKALVQQALDEGLNPKDILEQGLLAGMAVVGRRFTNDEIFVPEVLVAARAMNRGAALLKPALAEIGATALGKAIIGTVHGDLHDIGKNLVKLMLEGKGIEVIDLGVDVPPEQFVEEYRQSGAPLICLSALLTTTMPAMKATVEAFSAAGLRDQVTIMVGGAPVSQTFCEAIGADIYTPDAGSAAEMAKQVLLGQSACQ